MKGRRGGGGGRGTDAWVLPGKMADDTIHVRTFRCREWRR